MYQETKVSKPTVKLIMIEKLSIKSKPILSGKYLSRKGGNQLHTLRITNPINLNKTRKKITQK